MWSVLIDLFVPQNFIVLSAGAIYRIYRLLYIEYTKYVRLTPNECSRYDIKQSNGKVPVMLELWGMRSTAS